jgi:hypothetical protein
MASNTSSRLLLGMQASWRPPGCAASGRDCATSGTLHPWSGPTVGLLSGSHFLWGPPVTPARFFTFSAAFVTSGTSMGLGALGQSSCCVGPLDGGGSVPVVVSPSHFVVAFRCGVLSSFFSLLAY